MEDPLKNREVEDLLATKQKLQGVDEASAPGDEAAGVVSFNIKQ